MTVEPSYNYIYRCTARVVDGDTVDAQVDLGFSVYVRIRFRLLGINAPEMRSTNEAERKAGMAARDFLANLIHSKPLTVKSERPVAQEKYGRWLGQFFLEDGTSISSAMVMGGHAKRYDGGKREAFTP